MMRFRLRTLLILLAILPPMIAGMWFSYLDFRERQRLAADREIQLVLAQILYDTQNRTVIQYSGSLLVDLPAETLQQILRERLYGVESPDETDD